MVKVGGTSLNTIEEREFSDGQSIDASARKLSVTPPNVYGFGHQEYFELIYKHLHTGKLDPSISDGVEGRKSLALILAMYESSRKKQLIALT